jgi:hypothetical protein
MPDSDNKDQQPKFYTTPGEASLCAGATWGPTFIITSEWPQPVRISDPLPFILLEVERQRKQILDLGQLAKALLERIGELQVNTQDAFKRIADLEASAANKH